MEQVNNTYELLRHYITTSQSRECKQELIDRWSSEVVSREDFSFDTGLLGLGWLVGYLIQEKHIEGDANEVLEDIDDTVYKLTIKEVLSGDLDIERLLQFVTYYQQRLCYHSQVSFYRRFTHFECMKLLIDKLNKFLLETPACSEVTVRQKTTILLKYSFLIRTCVSEGLVEVAFYQAIEELIQLFGNDPDISTLQPELVKLLLCVQQYEHPYWEHSIGKIGNFNYEDCYSPWELLAFNQGGSPVKLDDLLNNNKYQLESRLLFTILTNIKAIHA